MKIHWPPNKANVCGQKDNINKVEIIYAKYYFFLFILLIKNKIKKYILKKLKNIVRECGLKELNSLIKNRFVANKINIKFKNLIFFENKEVTL